MQADKYKTSACARNGLARLHSTRDSWRRRAHARASERINGARGLTILLISLLLSSSSMLLPLCGGDGERTRRMQRGHRARATLREQAHLLCASQRSFKLTICHIAQAYVSLTHTNAQCACNKTAPKHVCHLFVGSTGSRQQHRALTRTRKSIDYLDYHFERRAGSRGAAFICSFTLLVATVAH